MYNVAIRDLLREVAAAAALLISERVTVDNILHFNSHFNDALISYRSGWPALPFRLTRPGPEPEPGPPPEALDGYARQQPVVGKPDQVSAVEVAPPLESSRQMDLRDASGKISFANGGRLERMRRKAGPYFISGADLLKLRSNENLTQYDIAEHMDVAQSQVGRLEHDQAVAKVSQYKALRRALGLPEEGPVV
jgi:hypothetical protein